MLTLARLPFIRGLPALHCRHAHTLPKNTIFLPKHITNDETSQRKLPAGINPVACLLGWVGCKERAIRKYASLYTNRGIDVVAVLVKPEHVYRPVSHGLATAERLVEILSSSDNTQRNVLIHGFSAGAYMYGNLLTACNARGDAGVAFTQRIKGFVFDSPVDINGVPFGLSRAIFGIDSEGTVRQRMVQIALETFLSERLPMRKYYQASSDAMHGHEFSAGFSSPLAVPSTFLYSESDSVTVSKDIQTVSHKWKACGSEVEEIMFEGTKHVMHMQRYPEEYEAAVANVVFKAFGECEVR